jgi:hypothetical protein
MIRIDNLSILIAIVAFSNADAQVGRNEPRFQRGVAEVFKLDNSWTSGGPGNMNGSQVFAAKPLASRVSLGGPTTGFAPA